MTDGKIISINKDLYTVTNGDSVFPCSVRGKLKNIKLTVGDNVLFNKDTLTIEDVKERNNTLSRPLVSNIDTLFIVISTHLPKYSAYLLDKFLVLSHYNNIKPVIIFTKLDLCSKEEKNEVKLAIKYYKKIGYNVYTNKEIRKIKREMKNSVIALAGQTGAGKSTLLNKIDKSLNLKTGEVSVALGRGRHTTRLVELIRVGSSLIADTPGFSSLELDVPKERIKEFFIEFKFNCKYNTCNHIDSENCDVIQRLESGKIMKSRYESYLKLMKETYK